MKNNWKEDFDKRFNYINSCIDYYTIEHYMNINKAGYEHLNDIKEFIENLLAEQKKELSNRKIYQRGYDEGKKKQMEDDRRFILNVLDGIDIADKQAGVIGGTQTIRQALKSRVI